LSSKTRADLTRLALLAGLLAASAGARDAHARAEAHAPPSPIRLTVKGSDTIGGELGPALAKAFEVLHPGASVTWEGLGSKTAFVGLLDGSADLGASSRAVSESELGEAARLGIKLREWVIAYDGEPIIVHPDNPIPSLSLDQLSDIFTGKIDNWKALGGSDAPIQLVVRPSYSGTRAFFEEKALRGAAISPTAIVLEHNEEVVARVAKVPQAIGFVGLASVISPARTGAVRVVPLSREPGAAAVPVSPERIRDGSYPLCRMLYLYSRGEPDAGAAELIRFILSSDGQAVVREVGFVPLDDAARAQALGALGDGGGQVAAAPPVRVWFPAGSTVPDSAGLVVLARLAERTRHLDARDRRLVIVGHADARGAGQVNERIARARAESVASLLNDLGVRRERITVEAHGADAPLASNETPVGREKNRRVDVYLLPEPRH
jgi:phosphate binding protein